MKNLEEEIENIGTEIVEDQKKRVTFPYECEIEETKDGFSGIVPIPTGHVSFHAQEVSLGFREINCSLSINVEDNKQGYLQPTRKRQINIKSNSTVKDLISSLKSIYKEQNYKWELIVEVFLAKIINQIEAKDAPEFLTGLETFHENNFLLYPFLQQDAPTLLFADKGTGKGWFVIRLVLSLITGEPFLSFSAPKGVKTLYIDYEDEKNTFENRVRMVASGLGYKYTDIAKNLAYKRAYSPIFDQMEYWRRFVQQNDIGLVIVDAGADAAGGDANSSEDVLRLFNALVRLERTTLIVHHEPKTVYSEKNSFYGSAYWSGRARIAWRLQTENEDKPKLIKASMIKANNIAENIKPIFYSFSQVIAGEGVLEPMYANLPFFPAIVFNKEEAPEKEPSEALRDVLRQNEGGLSKSQIEGLIYEDKKPEALKKLLQRATGGKSPFVEKTTDAKGNVVYRLIKDTEQGNEVPF